jgi:hypothetical protein
VSTLLTERAEPVGESGRELEAHRPARLAAQVSTCKRSSRVKDCGARTLGPRSYAWLEGWEEPPPPPRCAPRKPPGVLLGVGIGISEPRV